MVTLIKLLWNCYLELWIKGSGGNVRNVNLHLFMQEIYALKICGRKMTFKALVVTLAPCQLMWVSINFMRHLKSGKWRLFWKKNYWFLKFFWIGLKIFIPQISAISVNWSEFGLMRPVIPQKDTMGNSGQIDQFKPKADY